VVIIPTKAHIAHIIILVLLDKLSSTKIKGSIEKNIKIDEINQGRHFFLIVLW
jgi:hypothetical protein